MRGVLSFDTELPEELDLAKKWFRLWFKQITAIGKTDIDGFIHIYLVEAPAEAIAAIPQLIRDEPARYEKLALSPPKKNPFPLTAKERQAVRRRHERGRR